MKTISFDTMFSHDAPGKPTEELLRRMSDYVFNQTGEYISIYLIDVDSPTRIPKQYAKLCYKAGKILHSDDQSYIGNQLSMYTPKFQTYNFRFTRDFSWRAGDFGDDGSCYWGGRREAKQWILDADGFAVQWFDNDGQGVARCWALPYGKDVIIFNGYGLELSVQASILSSFLQCKISKIDVENYGQSDRTLYINSGRGFALGDNPTTHTVDFEIGDDGQEQCCHCGDRHDPDDMVYAQDEMYCQDCYNELFTRCEHCEDDVLLEDAIRAEITRYGRFIRTETVYFCCEHCAARSDVYECCDCGEYHHSDNLVCSEDGESYCESCYSNNYARCSECDCEIASRETKCTECDTLDPLVSIYQIVLLDA